MRWCGYNPPIIVRFPRYTSLNINHHLTLLKYGLKKWRINANTDETYQPAFSLLRDTCPTVSVFNLVLPYTNTLHYLGHNLLISNDQLQQLYRLLSRRLSHASRQSIRHVTLCFVHYGFTAVRSSVQLTEKFSHVTPAKISFKISKSNYYRSKLCFKQNAADFNVPYFNDIFLKYVKDSRTK